MIKMLIEQKIFYLLGFIFGIILFSVGFYKSNLIYIALGLILSFLSEIFRKQIDKK